MTQFRNAKGLDEPGGWDLKKVKQDRGEREFPFPTIFGNTGLRFPFPKFGNEFFVPVPKSWECFFDSRSQNLGMQFSIPVPVNGNGLSRRE